jgi:hypothetical protein
MANKTKPHLLKELAVIQPLSKDLEKHAGELNG